MGCHRVFVVECLFVDKIRGGRRVFVVNPAFRVYFLCKVRCVSFDRKVVFYCIAN